MYALRLWVVLIILVGKELGKRCLICVLLFSLKIETLLLVDLVVLVFLRDTL
jgi:hypothetical protein